MSLQQAAVVVVCDTCGRKFPTPCTTGAGARRDAERHGWLVAYLAGGQHPTKRANDPKLRDRCPACLPTPPAPPGALI